MNWADFRAGALFGGGVNGYLQSLALELRSRGHDLISLTGGWTYLAEKGRVPGECRVRRLEDFEGVSRFEIINSPVIAPGIFQAMEPEAEVNSAELDSVFSDFVGMCRPDVVHFHNIEGFSASCVRALTSMPRGTRPVVIFSLHNYHTICPQVYLMRNGRLPCKDFEGGSACTSCMSWTRRTNEIFERCGLSPNRESGLQEKETGHDKAVGDSACDIILRSEHEPLENDPDVEGMVGDSDEPHAHRRKAMIDMLSSCDAVLAVSGFVAQKFATMGVDPARLKRMQIGTTLGDSIIAREPRTPPSGERAVRLVFMGYHNYYKGLHMLVDSLSLLEPAHRKRVELNVFAKDLKSMESRLHSLEADLAGIRIRGEYRRDELPELLSEMDIGVVPSVWWDNGPQTVMEFLACQVPVLGAELGGIPDLVHHGENGWLFRGNDRHALMRQLTQLIDDPQAIECAAAKIKPVLSMRDHASEMLSLYQDCIS